MTWDIHVESFSSNPPKFLVIVFKQIQQKKWVENQTGGRSCDYHNKLFTLNQVFIKTNSLLTFSWLQ